MAVFDPAAFGLPATDFASTLAPLDLGLPDLSFVGPAVSAPAPAVAGSFADSLQGIANSIVSAANTFYGTQAQLAQARAQSQITSAQAANAVAAARTGAPSPYVWLLGGLGVVALLIVTRK